MTQLAFSASALSDLKEIRDYIEARAASAVVADRWIDRLLRESLDIAEMPGTGKPLDYVAQGLRARAIKSYVIYYRFDKDSNETRILRILHGAREFSTDFFS
jgi:plasmid stabilization system protein ParE